MITLRRASERHCEQHADPPGTSESLLSFAPELGTAQAAEGFGALRSLTESRLPPGGSVEHAPLTDAEVLLYVRAGTLAYGDSLGGSGVLRAGEVQQRTAADRVRHRETNTSHTEVAHYFTLAFALPQVGLAPGRQQQRFSVALRSGSLCVIASPDAQRDSLGLHLDALVSSALLEAGQHVVHAIAPGRGAWLHAVEGELGCGDLVLTTGDGLGIAREPVLSFTARLASEVLVVDLAVPHQVPSPGGTP